MFDDQAIRIVDDAINGRRPVDEKAFLSVEALAERLERIKSRGGLFGKIGFSSQVARLVSTRELSVVS